MTPASSRVPFRVALLGTGVIAEPHIGALRSFGGLVDVIAVCDLDGAKCRAFQQQHGIPHAFESLNAMLEQVSPDVIHVLLPPTAHASAAERCVEAGSHVFVEKPFAISRAECRRVQAAAAAAGRTIGVNHNLTFMPAFLKLIEAIRAYRLGALRHVRVMYNLPAPVETMPHSHWMFRDTGNLILELGPHPLSLICRLLGEVQQASTAVSGELTLTNGTQFFRTWQSSMVCDRGTAQCVLSMGGNYSSTSVHVVGQDGEAFVDFRRNTIRLSEKSPYLRADDLVDAWKNGAGLTFQGIRNFVSYAKGTVKLAPPYVLQNISVINSAGAFYRALREGRVPPIGATEGTAVVSACEMVIDSAMRFVSERGGACVASR